MKRDALRARAFSVAMIVLLVAAVAGKAKPLGFWAGL
jgi:hypothetical protein